MDDEAQLHRILTRLSVTQDLHKQLEKRISEFHGTDDTILYPSCFDANAGLFEAILTAEDAVISDQLNHASIIDGIRLCKAKRYRCPPDLAQTMSKCNSRGHRRSRAACLPCQVSAS